MIANVFTTQKHQILTLFYNSDKKKLWRLKAQKSDTEKVHRNSKENRLFLKFAFGGILLPECF